MESLNKLQIGDAINLTVLHQGAPIIGSGQVKIIYPSTVLLEVELESKYCVVGVSFKSPNEPCGVYIHANEDSVFLHPEYNRVEPTSVAFADFVGWSVYAVNLAGYTLSVCLIKD